MPKLFFVLLFASQLLVIKTIFAQPLQPTSRLIESDTCWVNIPNGLSVSCYYLVVPEDREHTESKQLKLPVIIIKSRSEKKEADPILITGGGPGGGSLNFVGVGGLPWANNRDIIIFEQRGTGYAQPVLDCPELKQALFESLDMGLTEKEKTVLLLQATSQCRKRVGAHNTNISKYNTLETARDIEDLRQSLKVDQLNLFGISYSTKVMLTYMREYPAHVRSAILDSPMPLSVGYDETALDHYILSLNKLSAACETSDSCKLKYDLPRNNFFKAVSNLNQSPIIVNILNPYTRKTVKVRVKGNEFASVFFPLLNRQEMLPYLPFLLKETSQKKYDLLKLLIQNNLPQNASMYLGVRLSVNCTEEVPFESISKIKNQRQKYPQLAGFREESIPIELCDAWKTIPVSSKENQDFSASTPTLILSGAFDAWTPESWGKLLNKQLTNSVHIVAPTVGHGVFVSSECIMGLTHEFYLYPGKELKQACIQKEQKLSFLPENRNQRAELIKMIQP